MKKTIAVMATTLLFACAEPVPFEESFRTALETAQPGDVVEIPAGKFSFDRSLIMNTDGVTIRGQGMDASILSFKEQLAGAEGLSVSASDFTIEDLAIEDAIGDALKVNEGSNIIIRRIRTEWTNGPDVNNGAYGIYPVQTTNVLIEDNVAIAASDAGIYVGQSEQIIVRGNRAEYNVAGIEVENSVGADVYNNIAVANTGGILVFNMPGIPKRGYGTRVFDNEVSNNNTLNFAAPGTAVSGVPAGSGIMVNSNDNVEIFNNRISGNDTANIVISSYFSANYAGQREVATEFDPYPELIYIYDNKMSDSGSQPGLDYLVKLRDAIFGPEGAFPDIIWDGVIDPNKPEAREVICVDNGDAKLLSIDASNEFANPTVDMTPYQCQIEKLTPIELSIG
ncbi:right-handed parallel beta-helix repeat-containing protein [Gammaproteobacteria bacterium]|nr:right-handed parallel beta-helix repeat-containing protein [Gammaproteobacteria bacterium]